MLKLGTHDLTRRALLAPMAGVADTAFRLVCRRFGAAATVSELISAEGLVRDSEKTRAMLDFLEDERPYAIQLFGANPDSMAEAVQIAAQWHPDWIDLNFGCPARTVVQRGAGSAMMKTLPLMREMVAKAVKAVSLPVTVKLRAGWDAASVNAEEAARICEGEGVAAITVHGRTRQQAFKGQADWEIIAQVKQAVAIPVVGNGDITTPQDAHRMLNETGCDAVMVGRGSYGAPWLFGQIHRYLADGVLEPEPDPVDRLNVCLDHYRLAQETLPQSRAVNEMRKHIGWYVKGLRGASRLRQIAFHLENPETVIETLIAFRDGLAVPSMDEEAT